MTEERYKQIKDSIELQSLVKKQMGVEDELLQEEIELLKAYEKLQQENQSLKKQLEENQNPLKGIFAQVNDDTLLRDCGNMNAEINELKNQQKEFINYLEDEIELYKNNIQNFSKDYEKCFLLINILKINKTKVQEILKKYKSIIGDDK